MSQTNFSSGSIFGGQVTGGGASNEGQQAYRDYSNNTGGLDIAESYSISLYAQVIFDTTEVNKWVSGRFHIYNGNFGDDNFGNIRVSSDITDPDDGTGLLWQAYDASASGNWVDMDIDMETGDIFYVQFDINPEAGTYGEYDVLVNKVNSDGSLIESSSLTGLQIGQNVVSNGNYGELGFHVEESSGTASFKVDNINITNVPEPQAFALLSGILVLAFSTMRRPSR